MMRGVFIDSMSDTCKCLNLLRHNYKTLYKTPYRSLVHKKGTEMIALVEQ